MSRYAEKITKPGLFYRNQKRITQPLVFGILSILLLSLSACVSPPKSSPNTAIKDSAPKVHFDPSKVKLATPRQEPRSRYGNHSPYTVFGKQYSVLASAENYKEKGEASWYGTKFHGRKTSSGEPYDMFKMTAAHKSLPLPSYVKVRNLENNREIIVRVNDRGPFHPGRIIDLSYAAAHILGIANKGTGKVEVEVITAAKSKRIETTQNISQQSAPTANTSGLLYVQVGAYSDLQIAQSVQKKVLSITQHPISIHRIQRPQQVLHRVLIGPLINREQGNALAVTLRQQKIGDAIVKQL
ncbi:MAG: septal ring lytic transglycosylase RlpA family protein [Pseudomonadales bacterium]|nr:septal ring lytic transglycosylase RlpA family protein [Pseudomonadales bacterium]